MIMIDPPFSEFYEGQIRNDDTSGLLIGERLVGAGGSDDPFAGADFSHVEVDVWE
jgi:hypothetical protein